MNAYTDDDVRAAVKATRRVKGGTIVGLLVESEVRMALDAVAPAIVARAKAEALREFAARMESDDWTHRDDWNVNCAYAFELTKAADEIERGQS